MKLKKNRYYQLTLNGQTYIEKFVGTTTIGYCFKPKNSNDTIYLGVLRLEAAKPVLVTLSAK